MDGGEGNSVVIGRDAIEMSQLKSLGLGFGCVFSVFKERDAETS